MKIRCLALSLLVLCGAIMAGTTAFVWSGIYDVSARSGHWGITRWVMEAARERSVEVRSEKIGNRRFESEVLVAAGGAHYRETCRLCHGGPGDPAALFAAGMNPKPPNLGSPDVQEESDTELSWLVQNGVKMTGMPSFDLSSAEIWAIVAFLRQLPRLTPEEYGRILGSAGAQPVESSAPPAAAAAPTATANAKDKAVQRPGPAAGTQKKDPRKKSKGQ